jgi:hypothetical protein
VEPLLQLYIYGAAPFEVFADDDPVACPRQRTSVLVVEAERLYWLFMMNEALCVHPLL